MLSEETKNTIIELQKRYPVKRSALIPSLHIAQNEVGYLPEAVQEEVAALFGLPVPEVMAIVAFYDMFHDKPVGKHHIHVCKNISCMLRGCDPLLEKLCNKLGIEPGGTTEDGEFTVIPSECLGACDRAPMFIVDDEVVGPVCDEDLDAILQQAKQGSGHPSPMKRGSHG